MCLCINNICNFKLYFIYLFGISFDFINAICFLKKINDLCNSKKKKQFYF